jgi:hypothetical protein
MLKCPDKIYISVSSISGRGVFAKDYILPGEILEECHLLELQEKDFTKIDVILKEYVFSLPNGNYCLVLGFGMIYNHSLLNNAYCEVDEIKKTFRFISKKLIKPDEEILINYQKWTDFD